MEEDSEGAWQLAGPENVQWPPPLSPRPHGEQPLHSSLSPLPPLPVPARPKQPSLNSQLMSTPLNSELRLQLPPALPSSEFTPAAISPQDFGGGGSNLYRGGFAFKPRQGD